MPIELPFLPKPRDIRRPHWPYRTNTGSVQSRGLALWWPGYPYAGGAFDLSAAKPNDTARTAALTNVTAVNAGEMGRAFQSSGSGFWGSGAMNGLNAITSPHSVSLWFSPPSDSDGVYMSWGQDSPVNAGSAFFIHHTNNFYGVTRASNGNPIVQTTYPATLVPGSWHHFCYTHDGTTSRLYYDGLEVDDSTNADDGSSTSHVYAMRSVHAGFPGYPPSGARTIDMRYYNEVLPPDVIFQMYDPETRWELYYQPNRRVYSFTSPEQLQTATAGTATVEVRSQASGASGTAVSDPPIAGVAEVQVDALDPAAAAQGTAVAMVGEPALIQVSAHSATAVGTTAIVVPGVAVIEVDGSGDVSAFGVGTVTVTPGVAVIEVDATDDVVATAGAAVVTPGIAIIEVDATDDVIAVGQGTATATPGVAVIEVSAHDVAASSPPAPSGGGGSGGSGGSLLEGFVTRVSQVHCECICPGPTPCTDCNEVCEIRVLLALRKPYADIGSPNAPRYINYVAVSPWMDVWDEYIAVPPVRDPPAASGWKAVVPHPSTQNWKPLHKVPRPVPRMLPLEHRDHDHDSWLPMAKNREDDGE